MAERDSAAAVIREGRIPCPDLDAKPAEAYLLELGIRGPVSIEGPYRPGRGVDLVFADPDLRPADPCCGFPRPRLYRHRNRRAGRLDPCSRPGPVIQRWRKRRTEVDGLLRGSERDILAETAAALAEADPDVLTGWNFLDFDYPRLAERFAAAGLAFTVGRSTEAARYMPGRGAGPPRPSCPGAR
jgi:DNA polymerase-2